MKRREFLLAAAAGVASTRAAWPHAASQVSRSRQNALDRIAIMTLNFQRMLRLPDLPEGPERTLELFDIPAMLADRYGVHKIEFQHYHIPSTEPAYLKDLRARIEKHKSRMTQINLEFGNLNISAPELRNRLMAIDLTKRWVEHAAMLGAQRVMINQGQLTHENKAQGIPALKAMADYGKSKGVIVSVETRGGGRGAAPAQTAAAPPQTAPAPAQTAAAAPQTTPAPPPQTAPASAPSPAPPPLTGPARWALLAELIEAAGAYSNVDVGGAGAANQDELHACLKRMFPTTANSLHARVNTQWDLATAIGFLERQLGYKGLYTIESSRGHEGTQEIYDVLVATLSGEQKS